MNPFDQFDAQPTSAASSSGTIPNPFDRFDVSPPAYTASTQATYEDQLRQSNQHKPWYRRLYEGLGRGAERGTLGLLQLGGLVNQQDAADIAQQTRMNGIGTGIAGTIGETALDPRYAAMLAAPGVGWGARAAMGAAAGTTEPVETADTSVAMGQRAKNAGIGAATFVAAPAILSKAGSLVKGISDKLGESGAGYFPGLTDMATVKAAQAADTVSPAYSRVANILVNQEGRDPNNITNTAQQAQGSPVPLTLPEATGSDRLLKEQRVLGELSTPAGTNFSQFNANRMSDAVPLAKQDVVNAASNALPASTLTDAGGKLQNAANSVLEQARAGLRQVGTGYGELQATQLPPDALLSLRADPLVEDVYQHILGDDALMGRQNTFRQVIPPAIQKQIQGLSPEAQQQVLAQYPVQQQVTKVVTGGMPDDSFGVLQNVKKQLDYLAGNEINAYGRASPLGAQYTAAANKVNQTLSGVEDRYAALNKTYGSAKQGVIDLENSGLGSLATAKTPESAAKTFMNMSREQLQRVVPALQQADPKALPSIASAIMNEVTDKTSDSGIKTYINALSKNQIVRDKMQVILSPSAYDAQQQLVDTLNKVITGLPRNSETVSKGQILNELNESSSPVDFAMGLATPGQSRDKLVRSALSWLKSNTVGRMNAQRHSDLMNVFLNPDLDQLGRALRQASDSQRDNIALQYLGGKVGQAAANSADSEGGSIRFRQPRLVAPVVENGAQQEILPPLQQNNQPKEGGIISRASQISGIHPALLERIAQLESNGDPSAANPNSSARGLFQFTKSTWGDMVSKYGAQTGITKADIFDPQSNAVMGALYARENADKLGQLLGRPPTAGEAYAAHLLGLTGAETLLSSLNSTKSAASILPDAAQANRAIFYDRLRARTPAEVYQILNNKINRSM